MASLLIVRNFGAASWLLQVLILGLVKDVMTRRAEDVIYNLQNQMSPC
jgi:hypothetical protein